MKGQKCKQTHMRGDLAGGEDWKRHLKSTADRPSWEKGGSLPLQFLKINHPRIKHDKSNIKRNQRPEKHRKSSSIPLQIKENDNAGCHLLTVRPADTKCEQSGDPREQVPDTGGHLGESSQAGGAGPTEVGSLSGSASWTCLPLWVLGTRENGRERSEGWQRGRHMWKPREKSTHTMQQKAHLSARTHTREEQGLPV